MTTTHTPGPWRLSDKASDAIAMRDAVKQDMRYDSLGIQVNAAIEKATR